MTSLRKRTIRSSEHLLPIRPCVPSGHAVDHPESPVAELLDAVEDRHDPALQILEVGDGAPGSELVCGGFQLAGPGPNPLRDLPPVIVLRAGGRDRHAAINAFLDLAADELASPQIGSGTILTSIGRLLLVETLREVRHQLPAGAVGLLAASRDEGVAAAMAAIHGDPAHPWTLESLAAVANSSRSTLTARFRQLMGTSIIRYLTHWRLTVAESLLEGTDLDLRRLAVATGYGSEAAFSRAFKRHTGQSPRAYQDGLRSRRPPDDILGDPTAELPPLFRAALAERRAPESPARPDTT